MNCVVFLGPTLPLDQARKELSAIYHPPAAQGDVYRAALKRPFAIGIIDGYFERVPAVWHKEILWALTQGIHVFGAASMGALRAAELADFGVRGVGTIFEQVRAGVIEDDDEVSVAHGDASIDYRAFSEAMVNIRATLDAAQQHRSVTAASRQRIERIAKELFYPDRTYKQLFAVAQARGVPPDELSALAAFVETRRVDRKREDALALLREMKAARARGTAPEQVPFHLSQTAAWMHVVHTVNGGAGEGS